MKTGRIAKTWMTLVATALVIGAWSWTNAEKGKPVKPATSADLGGKDRYLAHVSTDKPVYRTGEKVYVRSVILQANDHTPIKSRTQAFFEIKSPKGSKVASGFATTEDSVCGFAWEISEGQPGGEYTVKVSHQQLGIPPAERRFDIRAYRAPRIKTQIKFFRDGYGPGDTVGASLEAIRAEGGVPANAKVKIVARVDGSEVHSSTATVDGKGNCTAMFKLPAKIERGEGTLAFIINDGGAVETASKTIPILLQTVDLSVYPEGGDLIAELPCRVYVEAKTPAKKPADIAGVVLDSKGTQVGSFRTEHEGRGRFVFMPKKNETYSLKIAEPSGIDKAFPLPAVRPIGTVIQSLGDIYEKGKPVSLRVLSTEKGPFTVSLRKRESEIGSLSIEGGDKAGEEVTADITLTPPSSADGVLVATVWGSDGRALAERLIYREPMKAVKVSIEADQERYIPGGSVKLTVTTTDEDGEPVEGVVGVTVTDDSVLEMIEKREQAPRLPVMVLLEEEVKELADAHVYLDAENPNAPQAMDLLLGTQGWRRFAFVTVKDFLGKHGDDARRVLAMRVVTRLEKTNALKSARGGRRRFEAVMDLAFVDGAKMAVEEAAVVPMVAAPVAEAPRVPGEDKKPADRPVAVGEPGPAVEVEKELREVLEMAQKEQEANDFLARDEDIAGKRRKREAYVTVREYAHKVRPNRKPADRMDFTETLYWHAGIKTDKKTGKATVSFGLNDSVTSFRVFSDTFTGEGALGSESIVIESVQPFYAEPKLPLEVTMGDRIMLPVGIVNGTKDSFSATLIEIATAKGIDVGNILPFKLAADARERRIVELVVGDIKGDTDFALSASAGAYSDRVTRKLRIVPRGFPVEIAEGGMLKPDSTTTFKITIPASRVPRSVTSEIAIYPTPLANLTGALERLIRAPYGCFEQTSSTTYPLVMAQQYFLSHQGVDPKLIERSREMLRKGHDRLIGFECKQKGYEWFGADPGHEALTAYGLLEFMDMSKVHTVDPKMLERTREWLLGTKDGKGGFKRERRALHTWIADKDCSNGYIVWALLTSGESPDTLKDEIKAVTDAAMKSKNSYVVALGANVAWLAGDKATGATLAGKLAELQNKDGLVEGGTTTIVGSGGVSLQVETTALAVLAWLEDDAFAGNVERGIKWLADICEGGRYGSTQSTVLALRAILAYDAARSKPKAPGSIELKIDGRKAGTTVKFDKETHGAIELTDIAELLEPGQHTVEITMAGGSEMPCAMAITYANDKPDSSDECKVGVKVALSDTVLSEGKVTEANVTVWNKAEDEIIPTPIAIIGIPGGLEVRHDQLKELVKAEKIAAYEVIGREVVLYWRSMKAEEKAEVPLSLVAAIPGTYTGPASRAYLYYTDEFKSWANPVKVEVKVK
jgi:hypothetical protein